jgi:hypothetical protein
MAMAATRRLSSGRPSKPWRLGAALAAALALAAHFAAPALGAAKFSVEMLPAVVVADNATAIAVLASVREGFPNNVYAIKGTFSDGIRPYFGVTYSPQTTLWASQLDRWDGSQPQFSTDANGAWTGYLFVRLETTAPTGDLLFRVSGIPLRPVGDPGPTVGPWYPITALAPQDAARLTGHVYLDPECTRPAERVVVRGVDAEGRVLGAYLSQYSAIVDGLDHTDKGYFELGAPPGAVAALEGRTRYAAKDLPADSPVALYTRAPGPWPLFAGRATSVDTIWGDADGDGARTWEDVALCARLCAGLEEREAAALLRADTDADGAVTLADAAVLARALASAE